MVSAEDVSKCLAGVREGSEIGCVTMPSVQLAMHVELTHLVGDARCSVVRGELCG